MSQSATPATQNDITACFETFNKERFCSSHRHGDATGTPETRDETCWSTKTSISCETSLQFTLRSVKIDVSCETSVDFHHMSQNATPAREFAPCHHFAQRGQCDSQKKATRDVQSAAPATQNASEVSKVLRLPRKMQRIV